MIHIYTFLILLSLLVIAYFTYSKICEKVLDINKDAILPSLRINDGVDYIPLPTWKIFMIQLLNIAGLGPIFGAILGSLFGPVVFLWIVLGCIFIGGVHDYISGMLSIRHDGKSITEIIGYYLGDIIKTIVIIFIMVLSILVGVVFVKGPATLLSNLTHIPNEFWFYVIFTYYLIATMFPIDKIIGKIYPIFSIILLIMVILLLGHILFYNLYVPEITFENLTNMHCKKETIFIFPMLFITVACGAISGFHSTQSPMMARCMTSETEGRIVFYGAMLAEGIIALIWAAAAMAFFGSVERLNLEMQLHKMEPAWLINTISKNWFGTLGSILAILGVVICPITTGDTAFRAARLIIADFLKFDQSPIKNRLLISIPMFVIAFLVAKINFDVIWRYFAWGNQTLAAIVLWVCAIYLASNNKFHWIASIPATFMTTICITYILISKEGFEYPPTISYNLGILIGIITLIIFIIYKNKKFKFTQTEKNITN